MGQIQIFRPEDCKEQMLHGLRHGKIKGTTTHNNTIDQCWTWRKKESNIWTGYANEGKSLFWKQLALIKALEEKWTFAVSCPEDVPAEEYYDDLIHTLAGITTDKDYFNVINEELYEICYELIKDRFIFVYVKPPENTIEKVFKEFRILCKDTKIDGCLIDPLLKFAKSKEAPDRDDQYAGYTGSLAVDFCRDTNTSFHLVMHQLTPQFDPLTKRYVEPSMYRVKGGGSWSDGFDNVLSIWRPHYAENKFDTSVQFASQKIKKQKLVGIPQRMQISFDRKSNRYTEHNNFTPLFNFDKFLK